MAAAAPAGGSFLPSHSSSPSLPSRASFERKSSVDGKDARTLLNGGPTAPVSEGRTRRTIVPVWMIVLGWIALSAVVILMSESPFSSSTSFGNPVARPLSLFLRETADRWRSRADRDILVEKHFDHPVTLTTLHLIFQTCGALPRVSSSVKSCELTNSLPQPPACCTASRRSSLDLRLRKNMPQFRSQTLRNRLKTVPRSMRRWGRARSSSGGSGRA